MKMVVTAIVVLVVVMIVLVLEDISENKIKTQDQAFRCIDNVLHYNVGYDNHLQYRPVMKNEEPVFCPTTEIEVMCKRGYAFTYTDFDYTIKRYEEMDNVCQPKN